MLSDPLVTIVITTYNRAGLVERAVASALGQTYGHLEVIVIDDGSEDATLERLAAYDDSRLRVVACEHTGVPGRLKNRALELSRGDFIGFLDSDDVWLAHKLECQMAVITRSSAVGLVCCDAVVVDAEGNLLDESYLPPGAGASGRVLETLLDANFVIHSSAVVRRVMLETTGGFAESPALRAVDDYDLWLRIAAIAEIAFLPEPLLRYCRHGGNLSTQAPPSVIWSASLTMIDNLERFMNSHEHVVPTGFLRIRRAEMLARRAIAQRREGEGRVALRSLADAIRADPRATGRVLLEHPVVERVRRQRALRAAQRGSPPAARRYDCIERERGVPTSDPEAEDGDRQIAGARVPSDQAHFSPQ